MFCCSQKKPGRCLCFAIHQRLRVDANVLLFPRLTQQVPMCFFIHQKNLACACVLLLSRLATGTHVLLFTKGSKQVPVFHYSPHSQQVPVFCYSLKAQSRCLCFIIPHNHKKYLSFAIYQRLKADACVSLFPMLAKSTCIWLFTKGSKQVPMFCYLPKNVFLLLPRDWLEKLLKKKIDINKRFDYPLLMDVFGTKAIRNGCLQDPEYWQSYPDYQTTPLIFALHCQDFTFTHNLLQWGANPNLPDTKTLTPLMHAVKLVSHTCMLQTHI